MPEEMAKAAGIKKAAVLVGLLDRFEMWNPERYAAVSDDDEEDDDGLGVLDPALIGPKPPKPVIKEKKEEVLRKKEKHDIYSVFNFSFILLFLFLFFL